MIIIDTILTIKHIHNIGDDKMSLTHLKMKKLAPNLSYGTSLCSQELFQKIMRYNPSKDKNPNYPVTNVTLYDSLQFCNKLSCLMGYEPFYLLQNIKYADKTMTTIVYADVSNNGGKGFRVMREREWEELACLHREGDRKNHLISLGVFDKPSLSSIEHDSAFHGINDLYGNAWEWTLSHIPKLNFGCQVYGGSFKSKQGHYVKRVDYNYSSDDLSFRFAQ